MALPVIKLGCGLAGMRPPWTCQVEPVRESRPLQTLPPGADGDVHAMLLGLEPRSPAETGAITSDIRQ